jgi:DNA-binding CsgD family transcriptional regulator
MKLKHLSAHDAVTLLEIVHESLSVRNEQHIRTLMLKLRELLPYQATIAALASLDPNGAPTDFTIVNVEYPEEYLAELWRTGMVWKDPILIDNYQHYHLQYWADTFQHTPLLKANRSLGEDFGFHRGAKGHGYGHGIRNRRGTQGSFICMHALERDPRTEEALSLVVPHLHEALARIAGQDHQPALLTPREQDVLQWLAKGKNTWEVSMILNISERTVKFDITNITRKLDATCRTHAVAIALVQGLIEIN